MTFNSLFQFFFHFNLFFHFSIVETDSFFLSKILMEISVQFSHLIVSNSSKPHGPQHARPPCPSPTPRACSNSSSLSQWCHPTILSSAIPFSPCLQSFPASRYFQMSHNVSNNWIIYTQVVIHPDISISLFLEEKLKWNLCHFLKSQDNKVKKRSNY